MSRYDLIVRNRTVVTPVVDGLARWGRLEAPGRSC